MKNTTEQIEKRRVYMRAYRKKWEKNNPARLTYRREWMKKWRQNNPEEAKKRGRENYRKHKQERIAWGKNYRKREYVKIKERQRNQIRRQTEEHKLYHREYRKTDKQRKYNRDRWAKLSQESNERISLYLRARIRNALKAKASKSATTKELIGITIPELKLYLEKQFQQGMNWKNYGKWHIDHCKPLALFNLIDPQEQKKAFHYSNLQPLWASENLHKSKKYLN